MYVQSGDLPTRHQQRLHNRKHNRERAGIAHRLAWWHQHNKRKEHTDAPTPYRDEVVPPPQQEQLLNGPPCTTPAPTTTTRPSPQPTHTYVPDPARLFEGAACLDITKRDRAHGIGAVIPTGDVETFQRVNDRSKSRSIETFLRLNRDVQEEERCRNAQPAQHLSDEHPPHPQTVAAATATHNGSAAAAVTATQQQSYAASRRDFGSALEPFPQQITGRYNDQPNHDATPSQPTYTPTPTTDASHVPTPVQQPAPDRTQEFLQHFEKVTAGIQSRPEQITASSPRTQIPEGANSRRSRGGNRGGNRAGNRGGDVPPGLHTRGHRVGVGDSENPGAGGDDGGGGAGGDNGGGAGGGNGGGGGGRERKHATDTATRGTQERDDVAAAQQWIAESIRAETPRVSTRDLPTAAALNDSLMSRKRNEHAQWSRSSVRRGSYFGMFEQEVVNHRRRQLVQTAKKKRQVNDEENFTSLAPRTPFIPAPAPPTMRYDGPPTRNRREHQNWADQSSLSRGSYFGMCPAPSSRDHT